MDSLSDAKMFIGGEWQLTETRPVFNPYDEAQIGCGAMHGGVTWKRPLLPPNRV